jgi:hypothetical protein
MVDPNQPAGGSSDLREENGEDLGETLDALSAKSDVKAQAAAKADELTQRAHDVGDQAKQRADEVVERVRRRPAPLIAGGLALMMIFRLARRRRRRRRERRALERLASPDFPIRTVVEPSTSWAG